MNLTIKKYGTILIGSLILAFGLYNIHSQVDLAEGGVLGMILLLEHWFGINPSVSSLVLDISLFIVGGFIFGGKFLKYSLIASISFSAFYTLMSWWGPQLHFITQFPWLSAVAGGLFVGIGVGIVVRQGGACGGDDTLALIVKKISGLKLSISYLIMDAVVLGLSLSYIPLKDVGYSVITVVISSKLIEWIKQGKYEVYYKEFKSRF